MSNHVRRSPFRLLAPLALLAVGAAIVFVVMSTASSNDTADRSSTGTDNAGRTTTTDEPNRKKQRRPRGNTYTVKAGDTLGAIAEKSGIPVETLLELNPDLDPQALVAGQKITLRE
jgi:LysM repeat protein